MTKLCVTLIGVLALCGAHALIAQAGSLDPSFDPGTAANDAVLAMALQSDGRIVIAGNFTTFAGEPRNRIARLHADGSLDTGFDPDVDGAIRAVVIQPDGKILIGGNFTRVGAAEIVRDGIARLNADGSLDMDFNPSLNHRVEAMALQPDGRILIGGEFTLINTIVIRNRIARLNADGSIDMDFNPNANNPVRAIVLQPDNRILIGGSFTAIGATTRNRMARLNANGSLDMNFDPDANSIVQEIALQPDNRILIGGSFTRVGAAMITRNRIARLNADGSLDMNFDPNASGTVLTIAPQPDGRILIGGNFTTVGDVPRNRMALLNANGSLATDFDPDLDNLIQAMVLQPDGKILIGGTFTFIGGVFRNNVARLIEPDPLLPNLAPPTAVATVHYNYTIQMQGTDVPIINIDTSELPGWLTFDGVNTVSGTPLEEHIDQTFGPITVTASSNWGEGSHTFYVDVIGIPAQFTSAPVTTATPGFPYEYTAMVTGVPAPTLALENAPAWLTFDDVTGVLSGTPSGADLGAPANVMLIATGWGEPAEQTFAITVGSPFGGGGGGGGCAASGTRGIPTAPILAMVLFLLGLTIMARADKSAQKG